jgi:hypothetical protein
MIDRAREAAQLEFCFAFASRPQICWRPPRSGRERILRCGVCAAKWPAFFDVPDDVWRHYVPAKRRGHIVCIGCWRKLVGRRTTASISGGTAVRLRCGARPGGGVVASLGTRRLIGSGLPCGGKGWPPGFRIGSAEHASLSPSGAPWAAPGT